ncbi:chromosomal replication initiator protein DnaA [Aliicoccus persicus]|uniref:Chromosomal replication initiator protein DnaA n=1 Tax=Aliicoccus persicus TaxID=930138 RepID=A0A662Z4H1_9STAP|nr:chromosomal replication initiator protein DnaA [Aliicoccus persicus]SEV92653.1 chromosomal replication initiator protein DnaA [Aliicoccus persicus]
MEGIEQIWEQVLKSIEQEVGSASFMWFEGSSLLDFNKDKAIIKAEYEFKRKWLEDNYSDVVEDAFYSTFGERPSIQFVGNNGDVNAAVKQADQARKEELEDIDRFINTSNLNDENNFESFVIGSGNRFSHAASLAVAEQPGKAYNPLFIYGGVGLGKTHLMHSIGNYVLEKRPNAKVVYITSEKFTNDFISSIRDNKPEEFREKYRNVDVLLIDDIQFLTNKEQTQEEFFNTFNELHQNNKQIVISSDRTPKQIEGLQDRLESRFNWGLITDITPPDLETRLAILKKKCETENVDIPNDTMIYIANHIQTNIRELEGALTRVAAYSKLNNEVLTPDMVSNVLKDLVNQEKKTAITVNDIKKVVADQYGIRMEDFNSKKRTKSIAFPRQIAMYLTRYHTDKSLPKIGEEFGGRDHSTVLHASAKISDLIENDAAFAEDIKAIEKKLNIE